MNSEIEAKYRAVKAAIQPLDRALIAFSGGVDSSLVAFIAGQVLGRGALAITSATASLKRSDLALARKLAQDWGLAHEVIETDEVSNEKYRKNPINRCFYCKSSLYEQMESLASERGYKTLLNGTNLDDLGDHRPGLKAAEQFEVRSPLVEAGLHKADVRALADALGLENAHKPQAACLSSRFPYGTAITQALLAQVEAAEEVLAQAGLSQFRVRHHNEVARLEILPEEFPLLLSQREALEQAIRATGYRYVSLDLKGFRSGALNEGLSAGEIQVVEIT